MLINALIPCVFFSDLLALGFEKIVKIEFFYKKGLFLNRLKMGVFSKEVSQEITKNRDL